MTGYASIHGTNHDDTIDTSGFGGRADWIDGKSGHDTITSGGGNDTVFAGSGKDLVYAGSGKDVVSGGSGDDTVYAGSGNDSVGGGSNDDSLFGESGADTLFGDSGDDYITGGSHDDQLTGGTGSDAFFYDSGFGDDIITDFDTGTDVLEIKACINGTSISSAADLVPYVTEISGNAVISFSNGDSITLQGVSRTDLLNDLNDIVHIV